MSSKPIVVGVKEEQPAALEFAATAAKARKVRLRVVHCVEPVTAWDSPSVDDILWLGASQAVLDRANEVIGRIAPNLPAEFVLEPGAAEDVLLKEAENASMLVLGTDSPALVDRLLGGHVAEQVAKRSLVPVAIVPEHLRPQTPTGMVFVAIDATTLAAGPLRFSFEEASRRDNELYVVHVAPADVRFEQTTALRAEIAEILAGWSEQYPDVRVTRQLLFDEADEGCRRAGEEAEILVLGRHSKSAILLPFAHPVLKQVARRALNTFGDVAQHRVSKDSALVTAQDEQARFFAGSDAAFARLVIEESTSCRDVGELLAPSVYHFRYVNVVGLRPIEHVLCRDDMCDM